MKTLLYSSSAILLSLILIVSCKKGQTIKPLQLSATHTTLKLLQNDSLTLIGADDDSVRWVVTPSENSLLFHELNKATVLFYKAGTYTISATDPGHAPLTKTITVLNENYYPTMPDNPPPPTTTPQDTIIHIPISGDVVITPTYFKLQNSDSTGFTLKAKLSSTYQCNNIGLHTIQSQDNNNFFFGIDVIQLGTNCSVSASRTLSGNFMFIPEVAHPIILGTSYPLVVKVSGTTYTGSVIFNKTYMDITWNYSSGVVFTSKHVTF